MMHYRKGENIEQELTKADLPFDDCMPKGQTDFLWMHVKGGTKVNNVITYAKNALEKGEYRTVVWSGSGGGVVKTVSCAEILKRSFPLYQVTRMCYTSIEEHWKPQMEGLEEIIANRQIPSLHILMSLDAIEIDGVQKPNTTTEFWTESPATSKNRQGQRQPQLQRQQRSAQSSNKKNWKNKPPQSQKQQQQQQQQEHPKMTKHRPQQHKPQMNATEPESMAATNLQ